MRIKIDLSKKIVTLYYDEYTDKLDNIMYHKDTKFNPMYVRNKKLPRYVQRKFRRFVSHSAKNKYVIFHLGLAFQLIMSFPELKNSPEIDKLKNTDPKFIPHEFDNLYSYQSEDLKLLYNYKIGICQIQTAWGKTQVLATLYDYYLNHTDLKVAFITSSTQAGNELKQRLLDVFGIHHQHYFNEEDRIHLFNASGIFTSKLGKSDSFKSVFNDIDVFLFDEVEKCMTPTFLGFIRNQSKYTLMYGFSATPNKSSEERLSPLYPSYNYESNYDVVSLMGYATCYQIPKKDVNLIISDVSFLSVYYSSLYYESLGISQDDYRSKLKESYLHDNFIRGLYLTLCSVPKTPFIPINRTSIIYPWIEKLLIMDPELSYLVLTGSGYQIFNKEGKSSLGIEEAKKMVVEGSIDGFFSTSSGYNSIDFKDIHTVILVMEESSNHNLIQAVGRSRENIVNIVKMKFKNKIPIYDRKTEIQIQKIKDYYKLGNFTSINIIPKGRDQ